MRQWGNGAMSDGPVSNDSRSEVLGRVRRALGTRDASLEDEYRRLPREYIRA